MIFTEAYTLSNSVRIPKLALGTWLIPNDKTADPAHMRVNADVEFTISDEDMKALKHIEKIKDFGDACTFPVYGGKLKRP